MSFAVSPKTEAREDCLDGDVQETTQEGGNPLYSAAFFASGAVAMSHRLQETKIRILQTGMEPTVCVCLLGAAIYFVELLPRFASDGP